MNVHPFTWRLAAAFMCLCFCRAALRGQVVDDPVAVPVHFQAMFDATATGDPQLPASMNVFALGVTGPSLHAYGESAGGSDVMTSAGFARLRPGKTYLFEISTNSSTRVRVKVTPPSGHRVFINGVEHEMFDWAMGNGGPLDSQGFFSVRLDDGSGGAVGEAGSLRPGRVLWSLGLGSLRNGKPAGSLRLAEDGVTANTVKPAALFYDHDGKTQDGTGESDDDEVVVVKVGGVLCQVYATTILADIRSDGDYASVIRLYPREQVFGQGSDGLFQFTLGAELHAFRIENPNPGTLDAVRITKTTTQNGVLEMWTELRKQTGQPAGTTQWIVHDWHDKPSGASTVSGPVRHRWTYTNSDKNELMEITDSAGTVVHSIFKQYDDLNFGAETSRELVAEQNGYGGVSPMVTSYVYHQTFANGGSWHKVARVTVNDGTWTGMDYHEDFRTRGNVLQIRRPHNTGPASDPGFGGTTGEFTTFTYGHIDSFGTQKRPTLIETRVDSTTTGRTEISYTEEFITDTSANYSNSSDAVMPLIVATRKDYSNNTAFLTTITRTYREDADPQFKFFPGLLHSVQRPDDTMTAMAYFHADFVSTSNPFNPNVTGGARVHVALQGTSNSSMGDLTTSYYTPSQPLPPNFRLVAGKSSEARVLFGEHGLPRIAEDRAYLGVGTWEITRQDWTYYTSSILQDYVQRRSGGSGSFWNLVTNTWSGGRLTGSVDETGVSRTYVHDSAGRVSTVTRAGASADGVTIDPQTVTQTYDAADRVKTRTITAGGETIGTSYLYDMAGRVTNESSSGSGTTIFNYDFANKVTTATLPTGGTRVETLQLDGRAASLTGTADIPQYFTYTVENDGRRKTQVNVRTALDARKETVWADWLGRVSRRERPGFNNATTFVEDMAYDPTKGQLTKVSRTGYSDLLHVYNGMGERTQSGLDLNGSGGLNPISNDRITEADTTIENYAGAYWIASRTWAYHQVNSDTKKLQSLTRRRLTGLSPTLRAEVRSRDAEDNETIRAVTVTPAAKLITVTTTRPGMANDATEVYLNSWPVTSTGHDGLKFKQYYDALGRVKTVEDPRTGKPSTTNSITYYANTTLPFERFDAANRRLSTTGYDTAGRVTYVQDADTGTTRLSYNTRNQVEYRWGSGGYPVSYSYNGYGERTHQRTYRDPSSSVANYWEATSWPGGAVAAQTTQWEYDTYTGLVSKKYDAVGRYTQYEYNERGQTARRYWARPVTPGGALVYTSYQYLNGTGELSTISYNDGTPSVSFDSQDSGDAYTRLGQPRYVTDVTGVRSFAYDSNAPWRLNSENLPAFFGSRRLDTLYEETTSTNIGNGTYADHTIGSIRGRYRGYRVGVNPTDTSYDLEWTVAGSSAGRLAGFVSKRENGAGSGQFVYGYQANSSLVKSLSVVGNAYFEDRTFDATRDLLESIETWWSTTSRAKFAYTHSNLGQRTTSIQSGDIFSDLGPTHQKFTYNPRGELIAARAYQGTDLGSTVNSLSARQHEFDYDSIGNRKWANTSGVAATRDDFTVNDSNQYADRENNTLVVSGTANASAKVAAAGPFPVPTGGQTLAGRPTGGTYWGTNLVVNNQNAPFVGNVKAFAVLPGAGTGGADLFRTEQKAGFLPQSQQAFTYDEDGNLKGDGLWIYRWDAENRLTYMEATDVAVAAGRPKIHLRFSYDYRHRRVKKEVLNGATLQVIFDRRYVYDDWNVVAEIDGGGSLKRSFTWGLDVVGSLTRAGGVGALRQIHDHELNKTMFAAYDGNGNITALLNAGTGAMEASYEYSPFGDLLRSTGSYAQVNPFRFSTKWQDEESGLVYYGVRFYSPREGRFLNCDPIEEAGGLNLYGFCGNDGVNGVDVLGHGNFFSNIGKALKKYWKPIVAIVASVVTYGAASGWATTWLAGSQLSIGAAWSATTVSGVSGAIGGFAAGVVGSGVMGANPGDMLKSGLIGAATAGFGNALSGLGKIDPQVARFSTGALRGVVETGDIEGALKGGFANLLPTDLGVGKSYFDNRFVNFLTNTVRNAGQGYAINGKVGAERSVFGSLVNSAVGHAYGLVSSGFEKPTFKDGMYFYPIKSGVGNWLYQNVASAITLGNVVTALQSVIDAGFGSYASLTNGYSRPETQLAYRDNSWTYAHEVDHYRTQDILGAYYLPLQMISQWTGPVETLLTKKSPQYTPYLEQWPFKLLPYGYR